MRVLAIYRHYWPDVAPYARLLRSILERLASTSHSTTVYTAQPSYNDIKQPRQPSRQTLNGVAIRRLRLLPERKSALALRLLNTFCFLACAVFHVVRYRRHYDIIVASAHPPILMGCALQLVRLLTGLPYILHLQDIHPESAILAGQLPNNRLVRLLQSLDASSCSRAKCLVTLSEDMRKTLFDRTDRPRPSRIEVINNCALDRYDSDPRTTAPLAASRLFRVLFAGNMGLFQQLDRLIEVARLLRYRQDIEFRFMGAGAAKQRLIEQAGELTGRNIHFEPHQPVELAFRRMQASDLGVVSLATGVYRVAYPSKTMMYLAAGCPVLAIIEPASCLAETVRNCDLGYVPADLTVPAIAAAIVAAAADRSRWGQTGRDDLRVRGEALFGREPMLLRWQQLMDGLAADRNETPPARTARPRALARAGLR